MRILIALLLTCFCASGQTIQYRNLNSTQLASNRFLVSIKSGALLTNPVVSSGTITGSGSGLTNVTDANAMPKVGGVFTGGVGLIGSTNTGPSLWTNLALVSQSFYLDSNKFAQTNGTDFIYGTNGDFTLTGTLNIGLGTNGQRAINLNSVNCYIGFMQSNVEKFVIGADATGGSQFLIYDAVNAITRMAIKATGKVGIGTVSPTATLDVIGSIASSTTSTATNGFISYATHTPVALTVGASPFNFTNVAAVALECYFSGATAYAVDKNGVNVFGSLAGDAYFILQPGSRCAITYTVAPTMLTNAW